MTFTVHEHLELLTRFRDAERARQKDYDEHRPFFGRAHKIRQQSQETQSQPNDKTAYETQAQETWNVLREALRRASLRTGF